MATINIPIPEHLVPEILQLLRNANAPAVAPAAVAAPPIEHPNFMNASITLAVYTTETLGDFLASDKTVDTQHLRNGIRKYHQDTIRVMANSSTHEVIGMYIQTTDIRPAVDTDNQIYRDAKYNKYIYGIRNVTLFRNPIAFADIHLNCEFAVNNLGSICRFGGGTSPFSSENAQTQLRFRELICDAYFNSI